MDHNERPALVMLFTDDSCRDVLGHLLMLVRPYVFGNIAQLNRYCHVVTTSLRQAKQQQWTTAITAPDSDWVNHYFTHNNRAHGIIRTSSSLTVTYKSYRNGTLHGTVTKYNARGPIISRETFVDGRRHGVSESWHYNGNRARWCVYYHGQLQGLCKEWFANGVLYSVSYYVDGELSGLFELYRRDGTRISRTHYHAGKQHGKRERFDGRGRFHEITQRRHGLEHGRGTIKFSRTTIYYGAKLGLLHGDARTFSVSGQLLAWRHYKHGKLDGRYSTWYKNGRPRVKCRYANGNRIGHYKHWDANGKLVMHYVYDANGGCKRIIDLLESNEPVEPHGLT